MKLSQHLLLLGTVMSISALTAKDINIKGSGLERAVTCSYEMYEKRGELKMLPEGWKFIYLAMQQGQYVFDEQELSEFIPHWQRLYYMGGSRPSQ